MRPLRKDSPLNMKFLDVKFIKLDSDGITKPLKTSFLTIPKDQSFERVELQPQDVDILTSTLHERHQSVVDRSQPMTTIRLPHIQAQYRSKIQQLKADTQNIHKSILSLYSEDITNSTDTVKKLKDVQIVTKVDEKPRRRPFALTDFYDNLRRNSNGQYLRKIDESKAKIVSSNVHKKFEEYLINKNMRVPMFLKELR